MKFFTPELCVRFNSSNDEIADRANEEWEAALSAYQQHLASIRDQMPSPAEKLAGLCLHDAELLACEAAEAWFPLQLRSAVVSVRQDNQIVSLFYTLWGHIREQPSPEGWPFSKASIHWLYDEVDVESWGTHRLLHRVLLSDGRVLEIPFLTVMIQSLPQSSPAGGPKIRQTA